MANDIKQKVSLTNMQDQEKKPLLSVERLKVMFASESGYVKAVEGVDLEICEGESVAIVGESGCGKSVTSLGIMKLLTSPPAIMSAKTLNFRDRNGADRDMRGYTEEQMQRIRGNEITMIYQDPSSALNPVLTVGEQIDEVFIHHMHMNKAQARRASIEMLASVGIPAPEERYRQFPHELSGGMKQRILIAMATACNPRLMIADEPTTALDVTIQAQILELIKDLREQNRMAMLLITHDLGVVRHSAERVYVMYCGKIVEQGPVKDVLDAPLHPYTRGLIGTIPSLNEKVERFIQIPHNVPHPMNKPSGCHFSNRCDCCMEICTQHMPPLVEQGDRRKVRCWRADAFREKK